MSSLPVRCLFVACSLLVRCLFVACSLLVRCLLSSDKSTYYLYVILSPSCLKIIRSKYTDPIITTAPLLLASFMTKLQLFFNSFNTCQSSMLRFVLYLLRFTFSFALVYKITGSFKKSVSVAR